MIELTVQVGRALSVVTSTGDKIETRCAKQGRSRKESLQQMLFVPKHRRHRGKIHDTKWEWTQLECDLNALSKLNRVKSKV